MKIQVKSTVGVQAPVELDVQPQETVQQVVNRVAESQAMDPNAISLVHNGDVLPLNHTVKNVGLKEGDELKALPKNPTGGYDAYPHSSFLSNITRNRIRVEVERVKLAAIPLHPVSPLQWRGRLRVAEGIWAGQVHDFEITRRTTTPRGRRPSRSSHNRLRRIRSSHQPCMRLGMRWTQRRSAMRATGLSGTRMINRRPAAYGGP